MCAAAAAYQFTRKVRLACIDTLALLVLHLAFKYALRFLKGFHINNGRYFVRFKYHGISCFSCGVLLKNCAIGELVPHPSPRIGFIPQHD